MLASIKTNNLNVLKVKQNIPGSQTMRREEGGWRNPKEFSHGKRLKIKVRSFQGGTRNSVVLDTMVERDSGGREAVPLGS